MVEESHEDVCADYCSPLRKTVQMVAEEDVSEVCHVDALEITGFGYVPEMYKSLAMKHDVAL